MSLVAPVPDEGLGNTSWLIDLGGGRVAVVEDWAAATGRPLATR